jgi:hypothetical protein
MKELIDIVKDYISKKETDYALLINGRWGSGKTYFWKHNLTKEIEKIEIDGKKIKTLYVSVFGIADLGEISKKIFFELMPFLNFSQEEVESKSLEIVKQAVINGASTFGIKVDLDDFFKTNKELFYQLKNCVLCIDDIERSTRVDITEILGYVNSFVEHDNIKVILIGNEEEINKSSQYEAYEYIKEKTIGKTINFVSDIHSILEDIINLYREDSPYHHFLSSRKNLILEIFDKSPEQNLRVLKHAIADFYTVFRYLHEQYSNQLVLIGEPMLVLTLAASFELKLGQISPERLKSVTNNSLISTMLFEDRREESFENLFINRYLLQQDVYWFQSIVAYVISGLFDKELLAREVLIFLNTRSEEKKSAFELFLSEYWELSDEEFEAALADIIAKVKGNAFPLTHLPLIFYVLSFYAEQGLIDNLGEIAAIFEDSISSISDADASYEKEFEHSFKTFERKIFSEEYLKIKQLAIDHNRRFQENDRQRRAREIIDLFPGRLGDFCTLSSRERALPLFKYIDPEDFLDRIMTLKNPEIERLSSCLNERYSGADMAGYQDEYDRLCDLRERLTGYVSGRKTTLRVHLLAKLAATIATACDKIRGGAQTSKV